MYFGIAEAVEFHEKIGKAKIAQRIKFLANYLQAGLMDMGKEKVHMLTPTESISKAGVISFRPVKGIYNDVVNECRRSNIILRAVPENNVNCIRVSTHIYNSTDEIDALLKKLKTLL